MGIKVENNMLVLDSTFTKEDVQAIDEFVRINVNRERERIIKLLEQNAHTEAYLQVGFYEPQPIIYLDTATALIKNSGE